MREFGVQALGHDFGSQHPHKKLSVITYVPAIPMLRDCAAYSPGSVRDTAAKGKARE